MRIHRHLLFKKTMIAQIAKEKAQEQQLETLRKAVEIEEVRFFRIHEVRKNAVST